MSDLPEPAVSAELKAWLYNAIADSIPKALAAFHDHSKSAPRAPDKRLSDSEESKASDHDECPRKCPWKGNSANAGKGKAPAKAPKLSLSATRDDTPNYTVNPLEGSTSNLQLQSLHTFQQNGARTALVTLLPRALCGFPRLRTCNVTAYTEPEASRPPSLYTPEEGRHSHVSRAAVSGCTLYLACKQVAVSLGGRD
ncbi:Hypothetical predicted protein [Pelobates cultripes]|uniref:Uncharacterized protein n=1 Tax=Pelobates cultripes TaxID=61616 RepID=A0AAD1WW32_PELCU|nr:Hypothetical predicted protein [Pelobates cultripes]